MRLANADHLVEPLRGIGKAASRISVGLDILVSGLEIVKIARSRNSALNRSIKIAAVAALNTAIFLGVAALVNLLLPTLAGVAVAVGITLAISFLTEYAKDVFFQYLNNKI